MVTKTIGPLHFEDLEPHRFEDLVRQLIYDFRNWASIEATGRMGAEEGIDIRAFERILPAQYISTDDEEEEQDIIQEATFEDRLWIIQCKREKRIGPKKISTIVSDNLSAADPKPYGYMLVAACDFSKKSRDTFRAEVVKNGVQEFHLWGKAEVEDRLFMPKNDHLLFAYFGISLQVKRRSMKTRLRSRLALKRKLVKILGGIEEDITFTPVLIRDPNDEDYPYIRSVNEFCKNPEWRYWHLHGHQPPDHLTFIFKKHYAYLDLKKKEWDVLPEYDAGVPASGEIFGLESWWWDPNKLRSIYDAFFELDVPEKNRAWAVIVKPIHYDFILALDELGDSYNSGPHLLVEYGPAGIPFSKEYYFIETVGGFHKQILRPDEGKRISYFPKKIPDKREEYQQELKKRLERHRET